MVSIISNTSHSKKYMELQLAHEKDTEILLSFVSAYHELENIDSSDFERRKSVKPLLFENSNLGRIWLIVDQSEVIGYIAICFGYTIEFGGRDAFLDEFFIKQSARGKGIGTQVLESVKELIRGHGIVAIHLEVDKNNEKAKALYGKPGFSSRERYHLMSCTL